MPYEKSHSREARVPLARQSQKAKMTAKRAAAPVCARGSLHVCVLEARSRVRADEERAVRVVSRYVCTRALRDGTEVNTRSRSHSRAITRITGAQTAERGSQSVSSLSLSPPPIPVLLVVVVNRIRDQTPGCILNAAVCVCVPYSTDGAAASYGARRTGR